MPMRLHILAAVAVASVAAPAGATLAELERHLAATRTMTATFTQTAANGSVARGQLTLARPGKVRFEYEKGVPLLIVADGNSLALIDYEVAQVSKYPIRSTPLSVLLGGGSDLARFARVTARSDRGMTVEARDPKHPEYGTITIYFARDAQAPGGLALAGWRVLDAQGNVTSIALSAVRFNVAVADSAFRYRDPRPSRGPRAR